MNLLSRRDLWTGLIQLIIHTESISWSRLYNFLMGNSILVLAWATIYSSADRGVWTRLVMSAICVLGGFSGPAWAALGSRTRYYVNLHVRQAESLEGDPSSWEEAIPDELRPFRQGATIRGGRFKYSSNPFLLQAVPLSFTALYVLMLVATWTCPCVVWK